MDTSELQITPFSPEHQDGARQLILDGLGEHWGWIDEEVNTDLEDIASSYADAHFVLGWLGGALVATGALVPEDENSMRIARMSVARPFRKQGIGAQILGHLVRIARDLGMRKVVLETTETWDDVIAFYRSRGFRLERHRDGDAHMTLDLTTEMEGIQ